MENLGIIIFFIIFSVVRRLLQRKDQAPVPGKARIPLPTEKEQEAPPVRVREAPPIRVREAEKGRGPINELEELFERFSGSGKRTREENYTVSDVGNMIRDRKREELVLDQIKKVEKNKKDERARQEQDKKRKIASFEKTGESVNLEVIQDDEVSSAGFIVTADNAASGILFSEILGPPRARKPFPLSQSNKI